MDPTRTTTPQVGTQLHPTGTRCTRAGAIHAEDASTPSDDARAARMDTRSIYRRLVIGWRHAEQQRITSC
jgi:hypothetical protein